MGPMAEGGASPRPPIRPRRRIRGVSAVLLPFASDGTVDWAGFTGHLERTAASGLTPAVNMDTGYVQLLDSAARARVLEIAKVRLGAGFFAGAQVSDVPGAPWRADAYRREIEAIEGAGGTPVVFPSHGLSALADEAWIAAHAELAQRCDRLVAFELGTVFSPAGRIASLAAFAELLRIPRCIGLKHSSLSRELEWQRLALRDRERPAFQLFTGNDLAIDMVTYGSDYLLGLSTFAPDHFARRDALWEAGDPAFDELNDLLQYLGHFAFRTPVPAYRHSAAQFLRLRGWIGCDAPHPEAPRRPASDRPILRDIARRLERLAA